MSLVTYVGQLLKSKLRTPARNNTRGDRQSSASQNQDKERKGSAMGDNSSDWLKNLMALASKVAEGVISEQEQQTLQSRTATKDSLNREGANELLTLLAPYLDAGLKQIGYDHYQVQMEVDPERALIHLNILATPKQRVLKELN